jgi:undecaprenyl-diphosphatase
MRENSVRKILSAIFLVIIGLAAYIDEFLLQGAFQPSTDAFPHAISNWDIPIFILINKGLANFYLGWFFNIVTRLGSTTFLLAVCVVLYAVGRKRECILLFASIIIGTVLGLPIKLLLPRPRPYVTLPSTIVFDREAGSSFPSGHSMRSFAFAVVGSKLWPRFRVPLYVLAFLVSFARIYVGQHYPSDIIGGALLGLLVGYLTTRYETAIMKAAYRLRILPDHNG